MKRWVELIGGALMVIVGAGLTSEASDMVPFAIHEPIPFILGLLVVWRGWDVIHKAWGSI